MADEINFVVENNTEQDVSVYIITAANQADRAQAEADRAEAAVAGKIEEITAIKSTADAIAAQAATTAADAVDMVERQNARIQALSDALDEFVADGYVEDSTGYFLNRGSETLFTMTGMGGGGGGGGGGGEVITAEMTMENTTGWAAASFAPGRDVNLSFTWSSVDDGSPTGDGSLTITVNGAVRSTRNVAQGNNTINVKEYLSAGGNSIQLKVTDSYGQTRRKNFTITVVEISIASSFDDGTEYTGPITVPYTPYGEVAKAVKFELDGTVIATINTSASGRELSYVVPQQAHGMHTLRIWFEAELNGTTMTSNVLYYELICVRSGSTDVIIACDWSGEDITQYTTVSVNYRIYDPQSQAADLEIQLDGTTVATLTGLDRTEHAFPWRYDTVGSHTLKFISGSTEKAITMNVVSAGIDIHPVTENLGLYLSSNGRSNSEPNPGTWTYGSGNDQVACTFSGFNFISDGWVQDDDGVTVLRVKGDARLTIPYKIFGSDFRRNGKTIEIEFATRDVRDYSGVLVSCMSGGRGLQITAQECRLSSESVSLYSQFKEDEHVRIAFVVDKVSGLKLVRSYINGILSGVVQYPADDDFSQGSPVDISVGGNTATIDLYCLRIYSNDLTAQQVEENWIADTQDGALMIARYTRNNIRDGYGNIVTSMLPGDLPYMILTATELPQYKGDKKTVSGSYTDPINPSKSFTFTNAQADVQGTSSQYYARKNYKIKFNDGFVNNNNITSPKYQLRADSIPVKTFCFKADVASSEGANNVELVRLYESACPYRTPAQEDNERVRQGIDGLPIVIFWQNPDAGTTTFLGKYNFNNDKSTEEVFGFTDGDESWEIKNNTGSRVLWKSNDYESMGVDDKGNPIPDWLNDFEARYPDTDPAYTDAAQLKEFATWVMSTDPTTATGSTLAESKTYGGTTYTADTADYRKAKFRAELENYVEIDSALFYYLFTELFLMVDSRAKNAFPSFIGSEVTTNA